MPYHIVAFCAGFAAEERLSVHAMADTLLKSARRHDAGVSMSVLTARMTDLSGFDATPVPCAPSPSAAPIFAS